MEKSKHGTLEPEGEKNIVNMGTNTLRDLQDKFNEFSSKVFFLENCVSELDSFHEKALNGYHYFFQSVLDEMEDLEKLIDQMQEL